MGDGLPDLPTTMFEGRYLAESAIARGSTADVFAGTDTWSGEKVAIRRLRADRPNRENVFRRKAERLFGTTSARLVRVMHMGDDRNNLPYLVSELLVGRSADGLGRVRWEVACEIVRQAAIALAELAVLERFHGGLEASTLFVETRPIGGSRVKLLDLGIGHRNATAVMDARALARILRYLVSESEDQVEIPGSPVRLVPSVAEWMETETVLPADIAVELKAMLDGSQELPRY